MSNQNDLHREYWLRDYTSRVRNSIDAFREQHGDIGTKYLYITYDGDDGLWKINGGSTTAEGADLWLVRDAYCNAWLAKQGNKGLRALPPPIGAAKPVPATTPEDLEVVPADVTD